MPWRGFALSWERSSLSLCLSSFMFTVAPVAFMQRVSNYPSSKMEVSLQKIRYLGKAIGTEYNSPYKDSEPFWNFFPPTPRRKAFFVCCYGCPFKSFPGGLIWLLLVSLFWLWNIHLLLFPPTSWQQLVYGTGLAHEEVESELSRIRSPQSTPAFLRPGMVTVVACLAELCFESFPL
jgi:hypothetical protein